MEKLPMGRRESLPHQEVEEEILQGQGWKPLLLRGKIVIFYNFYIRIFIIFVDVLYLCQ